jgi:hypothetical protein
MESRASSSCSLLAVWAPPWWSPCAFRWHRMAAISTRCRWTRTRRRCTGGADEQFEGNSTNSRARSVRFSPVPGRRARLRSMADSTGPRCQHGMAATEERRVGRAGVWCDVLTLPMCTESHTLTLHRLPLRRRYAARWRKILRHVPPRSALRLLSSQASSPQQHSSPSALSGSFATSCVPSSRLGTR